MRVKRESKATGRRRVNPAFHWLNASRRSVMRPPLLGSPPHHTVFSLSGYFRNKNRGMNPMHREAPVLAWLQPFQELSTLDQQLTHPPLFGLGLGRIKPVLPARAP